MLNPWFGVPCAVAMQMGMLSEMLIDCIERQILRRMFVVVIQQSGIGRPSISTTPVTLGVR